MMNFEKLFLTDEQVDYLHEQTLEVLEKKGIAFEHPEAITLFEKNGFKTDGNIVFFTEKQVDEALKLCPKTFRWEGRDHHVIVDRESCSLLGPSAGPPFILKDGAVRKGTMQDYINITKLIDTSDVLHFTHNIITETDDISEEEKPYAQLAALLKYTTKPINITSIQTPKETVREVARNQIQMIKNFYGKTENVAVCGVCTTSPLAFNVTDIDVMLGYLEGGQPLMIMSCAMPVMTAPGYLAGMIIQCNAELLAGIVFAQLFAPGTPIIYANTSCSTNLYNMSLVLGNAETGLLSIATAALAKKYGLPYRTGGALSDAVDIDYQAGMESAYCLSSAIYADVDVMQFACGLMGSFNISSLEKYILDEQNIKMSNRIKKGISVEIGKNYIEEIMDMDPKGSYIYNGTPDEFCDEFIHHPILNKGSYNNWVTAGKIPLVDAAAAAVETRLTNYHEHEVTPEQLRIISRYI